MLRRGVVLTLMLAWVVCLPALQASEGAPALRPPAVPLVTCDPYFSIWSFADQFTGDATRHWTGARQSLDSMVRIDGEVYRVMGAEPPAAPALRQAGIEVLPTRTIYSFEDGASNAGSHS